MRALPIFFLVLLSALSTGAQQSNTKPLVITIGQGTNVQGTPDSKEGFQCSMTSGSPILVCSDVTFSNSDVGHAINVYGAVSASNYVALYTTISSFTNSTTVVLAASATKSTSSGMVQVVGATNNLTAIQNAVNTACAAATVNAPGTVVFPTGVYGLSGTLTMPNGCSYVTWTPSGGPVTLLETAIASNNSSQTGFGQGATLLSFGNGSAAGRAVSSLTGTSISSGSNVLTCSACSFTAADVGKPIYVQFAGTNNVPLFTTIVAMSGSPSVGVYPAAVIGVNAQNALPLNPQGLGGPAIVIGYQVMTNLNIGNVNFHNIGYWFQFPGLSRIGVPVVQFGVVSQVAKQGLNFHDLTILSATNGCTANNGPLDQSTIQNVTCLGATDAGFYFSGQNSNLTVKNNTVDNTGYPIQTSLDNASLIKTPTNALFDHLTYHCHCNNALVTIGDYNNFDITIQNSDFNGEGTTPVGITSNITQRLTVQNNTLEGLSTAVFFFSPTYAGGIDTLTITGNTASNSLEAIQVNDSHSTGVGPGNITFENNTMTVTGNGIIALATRGTNHWSTNSLTNSPASAHDSYQIFNTPAGTVNHVVGNTFVGFQSGNVCDSTCVFN